MGSDVPTRFQIEASISRDDELLLRRATKFWKGLSEDANISESMKRTYIIQFKSIVDVLTSRMDRIRKSNDSSAIRSLTYIYSIPSSHFAFTDSTRPAGKTGSVADERFFDGVNMLR